MQTLESRISVLALGDAAGDGKEHQFGIVCPSFAAVGGMMSAGVLPNEEEFHPLVLVILIVMYFEIRTSYGTCRVRLHLPGDESQGGTYGICQWRGAETHYQQERGDE